jgi:predicted MFS family arabinose efflux permease
VTEGPPTPAEDAGAVREWRDGAGRAVRDSSGRLERTLVFTMAVSTGLAVANNYYAQSLLAAIGRSLHMSSSVSGLVVTAAQVGYALGLLLLLPLGDLVERRRLIVVLCVGTSGALLWLGASPDAASLLCAAFVVGSLSVLAQILVPFSASLAADHERGRVVGMVMSGLLIGILLARTVAGLLAETGSWRVVYFVAAAAMLVQGAVLFRRLPKWRERPGLRYSGLIRSVGTLVREEPVLRRRALFGFLSFGSFSVLWTSMAFLLARHYGYSTAVIGLFGLAGAAGAAAATVAGRLSDRRRTTLSTGWSTALLSVSWLVMLGGGTHIALMVVGVIVLDVGAQGLHITNQGEIYRLRPEARSRLNSAYMVTYFAGGAIGSAASALAYARLGWDGVCMIGAGFATASFGLWVFGSSDQNPTSSIS